MEQKGLVTLETSGNELSRKSELQLIQALHSRVVKVGLLQKRGHLRKNWSQRYFVLTGAAIEYYKSEEAYRTKSKPKGRLELTQQGAEQAECKARQLDAAEVKEGSSGGQNQFEIMRGKESLRCGAETDEECMVWVESINEVASEVQQYQASLSTAAAMLSRGSSSQSVKQTRARALSASRGGQRGSRQGRGGGSKHLF